MNTPNVRTSLGVRVGLAILLGFVFQPHTPAVRAQPGDARASAADRARAIDAVERHDLPLARRLYTDLIARFPSDWALHYNLACVHALSGDPDLALKALEESISLGYTDFDHLASDPHLRSLHDIRRFQVILAARPDILDARAKADLNAAIEALGPRYRTLQDPDLRLNYVCAMDETALESARAEIAKVAKWADAEVWQHEQDQELALTAPWVTVILATPEDYVKFVPVPGVGGVYDHDRRMLVAQDIGPSLRHEFMHLLHYRRMMRLGQRHAFWLQEGLGSLPEDFTDARPGVSWRTNILRRLARHNALASWDELFAMPKERFTTLRPVANYAQARGVFLFLSEKGKLPEWLSAYERALAEKAERAERVAFEQVFGEPIGAVERSYRQWAKELPEVAEKLGYGDASLGVVVGPGDGDGPRVEAVEDERGFSPGNRLWTGDVISAVGGVVTPTMQELVQALSGYGVGDEVEVSVRRGKKRETVRVRLVAR
ncbi:MAG: PDZ domain-containing protein [Phycisphaerales bacterium]